MRREVLSSPVSMNGLQQQNVWRHNQLKITCQFTFFQSSGVDGRLKPYMQYMHTEQHIIGRTGKKRVVLFFSWAKSWKFCHCSHSYLTKKNTFYHLAAVNVCLLQGFCHFFSTLMWNWNVCNEKQFAAVILPLDASKPCMPFHNRTLYTPGSTFWPLSPTNLVFVRRLCKRRRNFIGWCQKWGLQRTEAKSCADKINGLPA